MAKKSNKYAGTVPEEELDGLKNYFGLGRNIDFDDRITRLSLLCAVVGGAAAALWQLLRHAAFGDAATVGVGMIMECFFAFFIAQELDPDRKYAGLFGCILTVVAAAFLGMGNILAMLWLLFLLRMLTRSSGSRHRIGDNIIIIGCAAWMGWDGYWLYPLATGAVYALESQLAGGYFRSLYLAAISLFGLALGDLHKIVPTLSINYIYLMCFTFIVFLPEIRLATITRARDDRLRKPLNVRRLQSAQGVFLLLVVSISFMHGDVQVVTMLPAMMAAVGCGACVLLDSIKKAKA